MGCWEWTWRTVHIWKRSVLCVLCYEAKAEENTWNIEAGVGGKRCGHGCLQDLGQGCKGPWRSATTASGTCAP